MKKYEKSLDITGQFWYNIQGTFLINPQLKKPSIFQI